MFSVLLFFPICTVNHYEIYPTLSSVGKLGSGAGSDGIQSAKLNSGKSPCKSVDSCIMSSGATNGANSCQSSPPSIVSAINCQNIRATRNEWYNVFSLKRGRKLMILLTTQNKLKKKVFLPTVTVIFFIMSDAWDFRNVVHRTYGDVWLCVVGIIVGRN